MNKDIVNYKAQHIVKDDKFDIDNLHHYNLSLQISPFDFQICVTDSKSNTCLAIESYQFHTNTTGNIIGHLHKIYEDHHFLKAGFWNAVKISFKTQHFSLIPAALFSKEGLPHYLEASAGTEVSAHEVHYYKHNKANVVNVFGVEIELLNFFREAYPDVLLHVFHQGSAFIEGTLKYAENMQGEKLFLLYEVEHINLIITRDQQLTFFNRFAIGDADDVVKYVMTVMKQMGLDQNKTQLIAWGNLDTQSQVFQKLYQYIRDISVGQKPSYLKFGYKFDEIPEHRHFALYSAYLCE